MLGSEWGSWPGGEVNCGLGVCWASVALYILFIFYTLLISIIVVTVHFLCWSVKLSLSGPTSFAFSSDSPPHPSGGRGDRVTMWSFVAGQS